MSPDLLRAFESVPLLKGLPSDEFDLFTWGIILAPLGISVPFTDTQSMQDFEALKNIIGDFSIQNNLTIARSCARVFGKDLSVD